MGVSIIIVYNIIRPWLTLSTQYNGSVSPHTASLTNGHLSHRSSFFRLAALITKVTHIPPCLLSARQRAPQSSVISYITERGERSSSSCVAVQVLVDLPSSASAVIKAIVAGNVSQALPVEPDSQVALSLRLTGSCRPHFAPLPVH